MTPSKVISMPTLVALIYLLTACGGNDQNAVKSGNSTTSAASSQTQNEKGSTIDTTSQGMLIARQKVNDFTKWKSFYEGRDSIRLANSIHRYIIGRGLKDSNTIFVAMKVQDMAKAKTFATDPARRQAMQQAGVTGTPQFDLVTITFQDTGKIATEIRSATTFRVKDWNTWQRTFDSGRQERLKHGLVDRAFGHDADDNHKVIVVVAVMDTAKAYAYWNSDSLKQRMARSGVIDKPERFLYRVTNRYK